MINRDVYNWLDTDAKKVGYIHACFSEAFSSPAWEEMLEAITQVVTPVDLIIQAASTYRSRDLSDTLLHASVKVGSLDWVEFSLSHVNPFFHNNEGQSAFDIAISLRDNEIINLFIEQQAAIGRPFQLSVTSVVIDKLLPGYVRSHPNAVADQRKDYIHDGSSLRARLDKKTLTLEQIQLIYRRIYQFLHVNQCSKECYTAHIKMCLEEMADELSDLNGVMQPFLNILQQDIPNTIPIEEDNGACEVVMTANMLLTFDEFVDDLNTKQERLQWALNAKDIYNIGNRAIFETTARKLYRGVVSIIEAGCYSSLGFTGLFFVMIFLVSAIGFLIKGFNYENFYYSNAYREILNCLIAFSVIMVFFVFILLICLTLKAGVFCVNIACGRSLNEPDASELEQLLGSTGTTNHQETYKEALQALEPYRLTENEKNLISLTRDELSAALTATQTEIKETALILPQNSEKRFYPVVCIAQTCGNRRKSARNNKEIEIEIEPPLLDEDERSVRQEI